MWGGTISSSVFLEEDATGAGYVAVTAACTAGDFAMKSACFFRAPNDFRVSTVGRTSILFRSVRSFCMVEGPGTGGIPENRPPPEAATAEYVTPWGLKLATTCGVLRGALDGWSTICGRAGSTIAGAAKVKGLGDGERS